MRVRRYCQILTDAWRSNIETLGDLHPDTLRASSRTNLGALLQKMDDLTITERADFHIRYKSVLAVLTTQQLA